LAWRNALEFSEDTTPMRAPRPRIRTVLLVVCLWAAMGWDARAGDGTAPAQPAETDRVVIMQRFVVSDTRIEKNPWRYASVPGLEVLTRASEHDTDWLLDALRRGLWVENRVIPRDWLPDPALPYTVIIDDTDISAVPTSRIHAQPMTESAPLDALIWGNLSSDINLSIESIGSHDSDTVAINNNLYGINTNTLMDSSISLERLSRCTPPLPEWVVAGLTGQRCGIFREAFSLLHDPNGALEKPGPIERAAGPGTLWVSLKETQRILKLYAHNPHDPSVEIPPLRSLLAMVPPQDEGRALWESEAALFVRWGLMLAPKEDPGMSRAFLKLVARARVEPITEKVFSDCFGFGYSAMEGKLRAFLEAVLAKPTSVEWDMPSNFLERADLREATSDQIGRMLGDWLRMKGDSLRDAEPELGAEFLGAAGRMLERAYRRDNGLPPDVDPGHGEEQPVRQSQSAGAGPVTVMKPFVVSASHIRDPGLLAVYGLYEHDIGDEGKAREFLEAAVKSDVMRPRAYAVLAELRYAEATEKPLGPEGKLSAKQAESIIGLLQTASRHASTPDIYHEIVEVWSNSEARPSERDIEAIAGGVALFPSDTDLAYNSALLCSQNGYTAQAGALIDKGLVFTTHEINRDYFEKLRSTLGPQPGK
jgi:hypothetical protein